MRIRTVTTRRNGMYHSSVLDDADQELFRACGRKSKDVRAKTVEFKKSIVGKWNSKMERALKA